MKSNRKFKLFKKGIADQAILLRSQTAFMQERLEEKQQPSPPPFFHQASDDSKMIDTLLGIGDTSWKYFNSEQKKE